MVNNIEDRYQKILYKGKTIYIVDYSNLKPEESFELNKTIVHKSILEDSIKNPAIKYSLSLCNVKNTRMSPELKKQAEDFAEILKKRGLKLANAYIGIGGVQKIIVKAFVKNSNAFNDVEEAKEWLINQID